MKHHCPRALYLLAGTKIDLVNDPKVEEELKARGETVVTCEEGEALAKAIQATAYVECSALTQQGLMNYVDEGMKAGLLKLPPKPACPRDIPRPTIRLLPSTFMSDIRALYNNTAALPDIRICFANGQQVLAYKLLLFTACPKLRQTIFATTQKTSEALECCQVPQEQTGAIQLLLDVAYGRIERSELNFPGTERPLEVVAPNRSLTSFVNSRDLCDIQLRCRDDAEKLHAHRAVLAARSARFNALFRSGMADATSGEIVVPEHARATLLILLTYLYTDELQSTEDLLPVLIAANEYGLERLMGLISLELFKRLTTENVLDTLEQAETFNCVGLAECCYDYMRRHWPVMKERKDLTDRISEEAFKELEAMQYPPLDFLQRWAEHERRYKDHRGIHRKKTCSIM